MNKPKFHVNQIVPFVRGRVEISGKIKEITLFRRSNTFGYLVKTKDNKFFWLGEDEIIRSKSQAKRIRAMAVGA